MIQGAIIDIDIALGMVVCGEYSNGLDSVPTILFPRSHLRIRSKGTIPIS